MDNIALTRNVEGSGSEALMVVHSTMRVTARILTGSTYALLGSDALRAPGGRVDQAASTLAHMRKVVPLPKDDELVVRANAAVQTVAGITFALGKFPRVSAPCANR